MWPRRAPSLCDTIAPDHSVRLISYFVFSSGLLPKSVWGFSSYWPATIVLSLMMLMREGDAFGGEELVERREE